MSIVWLYTSTNLIGYFVATIHFAHLYYIVWLYISTTLFGYVVATIHFAHHYYIILHLYLPILFVVINTK